VVSVQLTRLVTSPTKVTVGVPHASVAVTEAMPGAGTVALQPRVRLAGQVIVGGIRSFVQITVLEAVAVFPQPSVALNVLVCDAEHTAVITGPSVTVTAGEPQAAEAVAEPRAASISAAEGLHARVSVVPVTVSVGGLGALVHVTVLEVVDVLPQPSTAVNVLVCVAEQEVVAIVPSVNDTVGVPQASVAVAVPRAASISAAEGLHARVSVVPVAVIVGGVTSTVLVIVCEQVAVLPQPSVAI